MTALHTREDQGECQTLRWYIDTETGCRLQDYFASWLHFPTGRCTCTHCTCGTIRLGDHQLHWIHRQGWVATELSRPESTGLCNKPLFSLNSPVYYISTVDNILTFWWCFLSGNFINWPLSLWTPIASCIINLNKYNLVQMCEVECQSGAINFGAKSKMVYFLRYSSFSSGERDGRYRYYRPVQSIVVSEMTLGGY